MNIKAEVEMWEIPGCKLEPEMQARALNSTLIRQRSPLAVMHLHD